MPKFRVTLARTRAVHKDGTPMTPTQILGVRDVFAVRGRTEQRVWEFDAADEAEVRALLKDAADHPNVRGFDLKSIECADGVTPTVPVNRPATMEEAQHALEIGACLPNGVLFDAFARPRVRYVRVTLDGSHLILHPNELEAWKGSEENPDQFIYTDVYLSEEEADALPEFDGF